MAPEFAEYGALLNPSVSISNSYVINWFGYGIPNMYNATITDPSRAMPVLKVNYFFCFVFFFFVFLFLFLFLGG
jgi:hypothetical protein